MGNTVHINCDLGEGGGFDDQLMPYLSACNIACGGHFGNAESVRQTINKAVENGVQIGAHPAYPDRENFGRKTMEIAPEDLKRSLRKQVRLVQEITVEKGAKVHHVKPHGALYNDIVKDQEKAEVVLQTLLEIDDSLLLFVPPNSMIQDLAKGKLETWTEGFADRNYNSDFTLVSRSRPDALLKSKEEVFDRVLGVAKKGTIITVDRKELEVDFDTICLHSDTQNAVAILRYLEEELMKNEIHIQK